MEAVRGRGVVPAALNVGALAVVLATIVGGTVGTYELLLVLLLAGPMLTFLVVLASFEHS